MFMVRSAGNSFIALLTANAMESAGAEVVGVTYDGQHQLYGALVPSSRFIVFAKVMDEQQIDRVDKAIDAALSKG